LLLVVPMLRATEVEESKVIHAKGLGTATYTATDAEKPFLQKASPKTFNPDEEMTKAVLEVRAGTYISWFGIVREISRIPESTKQRVVVESKYFSGLGDLHLQTVSINGAGDFDAICESPTYELIPLTLVRLYGRVIEHGAGNPAVAAEYIRVWPLGLFSFRDYGTDASAPKRRTGLHLGKLRIYSSRPAVPSYYTERLACSARELQREWWKKNQERLNNE